MYHSTHDLVSGYNKWLTRLAAEGRTLCFGTILFHHLGRSQSVTLSLMQQDMQRKLPLLIGCPDRPVPKLNDGMHYHFMFGRADYYPIKAAAGPTY